MKIENYNHLELLLSSKSKDKISINLQNFTDDENSIIEEKLTKLKNSCGCELGGFFLIVGMVLFLIIQFYFSLSIRNSIISILLVLLFTIIGKMFGIAMSKYNLNLEIKKIIKIAQQKMHENAS